ncbi:polyphosphate kinase 2 family protein [Sphingomonas sp. GCM10030256]|uniref:polyphosphate kinase 2 family protein n=1 Tax=Sphingomonas sp. GCM10030256 TaxID=3273427 RepID=UPI003617D60D
MRYLRRVPIDLRRFERAAPFSGDYAAALAAVQERLSSLQTAQIVHGRRAIVLFEGWEGAGKKGTLKRLAAAWDPCHVATECVGPPRDGEREQHWLARFWTALPRSGRTSIFYHGWHREVVRQIVAGRADTKSVARACDEINEFENQQHEHETLIVKLFFHVSHEVQAERLQRREADPWRRWLVDGDELRSPAERASLQAAWERIFAQTDTRWAPWTVIDASDKQAARLAALDAIAGAYAKAVSAEPPANGGKVVSLASLREA